MQWLSRCKFARQTVPHTTCSNRESSAADRWQSDMRHHQAIGVGGAESSTTRYIGNIDKRPEVTLSSFQYLFQGSPGCADVALKTTISRTYFSHLFTSSKVSRRQRQPATTFTDRSPTETSCHWHFILP